MVEKGWILDKKQKILEIGKPSQKRSRTKFFDIPKKKREKRGGYFSLK